MSVDTQDAFVNGVRQNEPAEAVTYTMIEAACDAEFAEIDPREPSEA